MQNAQQFIKNPLGLSSNFDLNKYHASNAPTDPNLAIPDTHPHSGRQISNEKPVSLDIPQNTNWWVDPIHLPAFMRTSEPKEFKMPSLYAIVGAAFIGFISVYGFVEICFLMWKAFLVAVR